MNVSGVSVCCGIWIKVQFQFKAALRRGKTEKKECNLVNTEKNVEDKHFYVEEMTERGAFPFCV